MSAFRPAPLKPLVTSSALEALDLRVGEILAAEKVSASSKLVRLTVSFGDHTRTILAGLQKERENLQALVGWQTLFVVNLEPKRLAGEVSEGMLLDLGFADGLKPAFLLPETPVPNGTRAG
jgi:tRNA-binding protein